MEFLPLCTATSDRIPITNNTHAYVHSFTVKRSYMLAALPYKHTNYIQDAYIYVAEFAKGSYTHIQFNLKAMWLCNSACV